MMIAPTIQQTRCKAWIQRHLGNYQVNISDITSYYTAICVMGPFSRLLLSELTDTDLSPKNFPFFTCKVSVLKSNFSKLSFSHKLKYFPGVGCRPRKWNKSLQSNAYR